MMRVYSIKNHATGDYFVLEKDIETFNLQAMKYVYHLYNSQKCPNTYAFGSEEMSESCYKNYKSKAQILESSQVKIQRGEMVFKPEIVQ